MPVYKTSAQLSKNKKARGVPLRYPLKPGAAEAPCILFSIVRPTYKTPTEVQYEDKSSIALYMPRGIAMADNMKYANAQGGMTENVINNLRMIGSDGKAGFESISENRDAYMARLAAASGSGILAELSRQKIQGSQITINPNEYILFDAPSPREFSLTFKFMPSSLQESQEVELIIKEFRRNMYPELQAGGTIYKFPNAFQIRYDNAQGMIKMPEVVLKSCNVTYNSNSMSYHEDGRPIEIDMALTFGELSPISQVDVDAGY